MEKLVEITSKFADGHKCTDYATILGIALIKDLPDAVEALIEFGPDVNSVLACGLCNKTPLGFVIDRDTVGLFKLLV